MNFRGIFVFLVLVLAVAFTRLIPHQPNVTPFLAIALFVGWTMGARKGLMISLLAMFVSDLFLGFHASSWAVYLAIGTLVWVGDQAPRLSSENTLLGGVMAVIFGGFSFFLISNFGVWLSTGMYAKSFLGLWECYVAALPFFRSTLSSTALFFGAFWAVALGLKKASLWPASLRLNA